MPHEDYIGPDGKYSNPFYPPNVTDLTQDIIWASYPPELRALRDMPAAQRGAECFRLMHNFSVDSRIHFFGEEPVTVIMQRYNSGYRWVYDMVNEVAYFAAPGVTSAPGGIPNYDPNKPPPGALKVSNKASDYPPFDPPAPAALPTPDTSIVGNSMGFGYYGAGPGAKPDSVVNGKSYQTPDGKHAVAHVITGGMAGMESWGVYFTAVP